jgi:hypothetical protein
MGQVRLVMALGLHNLENRPTINNEGSKSINMQYELPWHRLGLHENRRQTTDRDASR